MWWKQPVLDKGYIVLENAMACDADVLNAAWASTDKYKNPDEITEEEYEGMLKLLLPKEGPIHAAPFRHTAFRFYVKCPLYVTFEWYKHVIGIKYSEPFESQGNAWSQQSIRASLVKNPEFYYPDHLRKNIGRSTAYTFERIDNAEMVDEFNKELEEMNENSTEFYKKWIERDITRELVGRAFNPFLYVNFVTTTNANSLMNFCGLRNESHAQYEIREYAKHAERALKEVIPRTYKVWMARGRPRM